MIPATVPVWALYDGPRDDPARYSYRRVIAWSAAGVALVLPFAGRDKEGRLSPAPEIAGYRSLTEQGPES